MSSPKAWLFKVDKSFNSYVGVRVTEIQRGSGLSS